MRIFETDEARAKSDERKRGKELRSLANKISEYLRAFINATRPGMWSSACETWQSNLENVPMRLPRRSTYC
jgi:hypothetical protein